MIYEFLQALDPKLFGVLVLVLIAAVFAWFHSQEVHPCESCHRDPHDREQCRSSCADLQAYRRRHDLEPLSGVLPELPPDREAFYLVQLNLLRCQARSSRGEELARLRRKISDYETILRMHGHDVPAAFDGGVA